MSPESGDGIRPPSPESGQPDSGDQSDRNPAIWPDSGHLTGSGQKGRNPAREPVPGRPWPGRPVPGRLWPGRPVPGRLAGRIWPDPASLARPGQMAGTGILCRNPAKLPESGHFRRNPVIPDSDETVRIPAFISNSSYVSQNQVKIVRI